MRLLPFSLCGSEAQSMGSLPCLFSDCQIAVIFEFTGALVLGRVSQETISGGIADIGAFTTDPVRVQTCSLAGSACFAAGLERIFPAVRHAAECHPRRLSCHHASFGRSLVSLRRSSSRMA
jgi:hypothetical protein